MKSKTCFKCGTTKLLQEFYAHPRMQDGHLNKCKVCTRADTVARKQADPERTREEKRLWAISPRGRATLVRYRRTHIGMKRKWASDWGKRHRDKTRAQCATRRAISKGLLIRLPCEVCRNPKSEAHHEDYGQPLQVRWLCRTHHAEHHRVSQRAVA